MRAAGRLVPRVLSAVFLAAVPFRASAAPFEAVGPGTVVERARTLVPNLRIEDEDFKPTAVGDLPYILPVVKNLLAVPFALTPEAESIGDRVAASSASGDLFDAAYRVVFASAVPPAFRPSAAMPPYPADWPRALEPSVRGLYAALGQSQARLDAAVASLSKKDREGFLRLISWPTPQGAKPQDEILSRLTRERFDAMKGFDDANLWAAGGTLMRAVDVVLPDVAALSASSSAFAVPSGRPLRWKTPLGVVALGGAGDDAYGEGSLDDVVLLIDLGGHNAYSTPVAAAREGQIRVVIDEGKDVDIHGSSVPACNAGCGAFGIGLLYFPNRGGVKRIETGSYAAGYGAAGVGGLFLKGTADVRGGDYAQGAAHFGLGIFDAGHSESSSYLITSKGQGYGWTRGVGLFRHEGNASAIRGGLTRPDPREPLGTDCECQGTGMGPRPYAAGGVGVAAVSGDSVTVLGNYFSMGAGYADSLGIFRFRGDHSTLQARRYDMGTGVHYAAGYFSLIGSDDRVLTWGVGPAYGWDHSVGASSIQGERNEIQGDWAMGVASIGSSALGYYNLRDSKLKLCQFGNGQFYWNEAAYTIQLLEGTGNRVACQGESAAGPGSVIRMGNPWGVYRVAPGTPFVKDLGLAPPVWRTIARDKAIQQERVRLESVLDAALKESPKERISDMIDAASAFSVDKETPRKAMGMLLRGLSDKELLLLIDLDSSVDAAITRDAVLAAYGGKAAVEAIMGRMKSAPTSRWGEILFFLRDQPLRFAAPKLLSILNKPPKASDSWLRSTALDVLTEFLDQDANRNTGRRALLEALDRFLGEPSDANRAELSRLVNQLNVRGGFGLLASLADSDPSTRLRFHGKIGEEFSFGMGGPAADEFIAIAVERRDRVRASVREELRLVEELQPRVRAELASVLRSTGTDVQDLHRAIVNLSRIGNPDDAALLAPFLRHAKSSVREPAAIALARFGDAGYPFLERAMIDGTVLMRSTVVAAVSQSSTNKARELYKRGLADSSSQVRLTALSLIDNLPAVLSAERDALAELAR